MDFKTILLLGGAYWLLKNQAAQAALKAQAQALLGPSAVPTPPPATSSVTTALPIIAQGLATALGQPIPSSSTSALK